MGAWRDAGPADDAAIVEMVRRLCAEDPGARPVPDEHTLRTLAALRAEPVRGRAVVLDIDGSVEGYALLVSFWSNELGGEVCNIDELYVRPAQRGLGHASALVASIARGERPWGHIPVALELEVSPANRRARALYERLGFAPLRNDGLRLIPVTMSRP